MDLRKCFLLVLACIVGIVSRSEVHAQVQDRLSAYTGRNASGYLGPLADGFATSLTSGYFYTARIPRDGWRMSIELTASAASFTQGDRTFMATTEGSFTPEKTTLAPTVVGDPKAVFLEGNGGTLFAFPGGFDLSYVSTGAIQLRAGSWHGTEGLVRALVWNTGVSDLGELRLIGFAARHSVSQYFEAWPVEVAVSAMWQWFSLDNGQPGDDVFSARATSIAVHASQMVGPVEAYAGFGVDRFGMDVHYEPFGLSEALELSLGPSYTGHLTLGASYGLSLLRFYGEYNLGSHEAFSLGVAVQHQLM